MERLPATQIATPDGPIGNFGTARTATINDHIVTLAICFDLEMFPRDIEELALIEEIQVVTRLAVIALGPFDALDLASDLPHP